MLGRKTAALHAGLLVGLLILFAIFGVPLAAQDNPDTSEVADSQLAGVVRAPDGTPVPGSTVRVTETASGKAWVTWTDESGDYEFPALPSGHYRVEVSQLGFAPGASEVDLSAAVKTPLDLKMQIAALAAITAAPPQGNSAAAPNAPPAGDGAKATPSGPPIGNGGEPAVSNNPNQPGAAAENAQPSSPRGRNGGGGQRGSGGATGPQGTQAASGTASGRRAFQPLGLNGLDQNATENGTEDQNLPEASAQIGQEASSADAVQMTGTVAMALVPTGGFPQAGEMGPGGPGGFGGQGFGPGGPGGEPGGGVYVGRMGGGPGGAGGPGGGPIFLQRGGGGRRGPAGGPEGVEALWGAERVRKQLINRVHFSFYDTYGNSALDARPYSLFESNPAKISSWIESAGMNLGGPLKIPHVYNGTDKTFFFINFGGTWSRNVQDQFATVPTTAERTAGDFSAALGAPLCATPSGQATTVCSGGNTPIMVAQTNGQTTQARQGMIFNPANHEAYAGNMLPTPFNSTALALLGFIPSPTPNLLGQQQNFHLQTNLPGLSNRLNVNVTHQISPKLSLQVNYNLSNATSHSLNNFPGIEGNTLTRGQSVMIALNQNWTKTFVHTSQLFFSRNRSLGLNEFSFLTDIASQLGITGISNLPFDYGLPSINFTNDTGLNDPNFSLARSQTYRYVDSLRWTETKHTITVGGEVRKMDVDRDTDPTPNGQFSFTGQSTAMPSSLGGISGISLTGSDFADFLLGLPANAKVQYGDTSTYFHEWGFIGYATDDWHIVPKFTLTYGVRYEAFTPPIEQNGRIANFVPTPGTPGFTQMECVTPSAFGGCAVGATQALFRGHYNNWAPRLGIAWQPPGKWFAGKHQMTVRGGFSMFYVESYLSTLANELANQPPFGTANTLSAATTPLTFQTNLSQGQAGTRTNTVAVDQNYKVPYAMIWNFGFEYNLAPRTFVEVMYTGTRGVHLDQLLGFSPTNTVTNAAGFTYDTSGAFSNLNALQVRLQKRMSHGLMFMARYTYSKSLDDASTIGGGAQTVIQNNADPLADYGLSSFDTRHQFVGVFSYQLPFGDRKRFATKGWEKNVFGGWRANGSFTAHSGTPYTARVFSKNPLDQNVPGINSQRANQNGSPALSSPAVQEWFNTSVFSDPALICTAAPCYGDAPRNSVTGPGFFSINTGLTKTVQFGRDGMRRLDFSWNTSNFLNHPNFSGLSTVLGSQTFGEITSVGAMRTMTFTTRVNF